MNTWGRLFRVSLLGESHGAGIGALLDGVPPGLRLTDRDFSADMRRRRSGEPGTTSRRERDRPVMKTGLLRGRTTGAPLLIWIDNEDADGAGYAAFRRTPRPGHADLTAGIKFAGWNDVRGGGPFSGRLTAALVAAGVVAKRMIVPAKVEARLTEAGGETSPGALSEAILAAMAHGDSIGGLVTGAVSGLPPGLGEPFFDSAESVLAHVLFAIPGVKGVDFGAGFGAARMRGSDFNDRIIDASGTTATNHAGGINGGLTNGNDLVFRVALRPAASIGRPQETIDLRTGRPARLRIVGRHDACFARRVPVVVEAAAAIVLADLIAIDRGTAGARRTSR